MGYSWTIKIQDYSQYLLQKYINFNIDAHAVYLIFDLTNR